NGRHAFRAAAGGRPAGRGRRSVGPGRNFSRFAGELSARLGRSWQDHRTCRRGRAPRPRGGGGRPRPLPSPSLFSGPAPCEEAEEEKLGAIYVPLDRLLAEADFVSLHPVLTAETYHMIDDRALALMKPTAFLINTSRGRVVDEAALIKALTDKRIAGAGLDVF